MITEDYVSFEMAKLLKEREFDELCYQKYDSDGELSFNHVGYVNSEKPCDDFYALAPTLQMAMKWLREVHYIFIYITPSLRYWGNEHKYDKEHSWFLEGYQPHVYHGDNPHEFRVIDKYYVSTYEEAVEAAIKYCLENLI